MRIELNTELDMRGSDFVRGTTCAVCGQPINEPPALWLAVQSLDFFLHKHCEPAFTPETVKRVLGDLVLVMQDESLHDTPPERN
jgi:hypothetical protein